MTTLTALPPTASPPVETPDTPLWQPSAARRERALITALKAWLARERGLHFGGYEALWKWSVDEPEAFWSALLAFFDVPMAQAPRRMRSDDPMPATQWFEGARLNLVDTLLRHTPGGMQPHTPAIVFEDESGGAGEISWPELRRQVGALAHTLRTLGVQPGDRVVGDPPNIPQAVVAFLAAASIGAVWALRAPTWAP